MNIFLIGPTGAGKTTVAQQLAQHYHQSFYDSDAVISARSGKTITEIFSHWGEQAFRQTEEEVIDELTKKQQVIVAVGAGAVLSQPTRQRLKERGTSIYLCARPQTLAQRLEKNQASRPLLAQQPLLASLKKMDERRQSLYRETAALRIDVDRLSVEQTLLAIIQQLEKT